MLKWTSFPGAVGTILNGAMALRIEKLLYSDIQCAADQPGIHNLCWGLSTRRRYRKMAWDDEWDDDDDYDDEDY